MVIKSATGKVHIGKTHVIKMFGDILWDVPSYTLSSHFPRYAQLKRKFLQQLFDYYAPELGVIIPQITKYGEGYVVIEKYKFKRKLVSAKIVDLLRKIYNLAGMSALCLLPIPSFIEPEALLKLEFGYRNIGVTKDGKIVLFDQEEVGDCEIYDRKAFERVAKEMGFKERDEMLKLLEKMGWRVNLYHDVVEKLGKKGVAFGSYAFNAYLYKDLGAAITMQDLDLFIQKSELLDVIKILLELGFKIYPNQEEKAEELGYRGRAPNQIFLEKDGAVIDLRVVKKLPPYTEIDKKCVVKKPLVMGGYLTHVIQKLENLLFSMVPIGSEMYQRVIRG